MRTRKKRRLGTPYSFSLNYNSEGDLKVQAAKGQQIVGELLGECDESEGRRNCFLYHFKIQPEFRGQGVGGNILGQVTEFADQNQISLTAWAKPIGAKATRTKVRELVKLYQKFGFVTIGDLENDGADFFQTIYRNPRRRVLKKR